MRLIATDNPGVKESRKATLYGYLQNIGGGREPTPAADFYPAYTRDEVMEISLSVTDAALADRPVLRAYEHGRTSKYGAQGGIPPLDDPITMTTILRYYREPQPCKPAETPLRLLKKWFSSAELKPYSYAEVITRQHMKKGTLKSSSGLPYLTERENVLYESMQEAAAGRHYPAILGFRAIRNGLRSIYMYPMGDNLEELSYVYPVMDWLLENTTMVEAWKDRKYIVAGIQKEFPNEPVTHVSGDYEKMDTTVQREQVAVGADLICSMFQRKYRQGVRKSLAALTTKPAVITAVKKNGTVPTATTPGHPSSLEFFLTDQDHGLFSGSGWTNCLETVLNIAVNFETAMPYQIAGTQSDGDDSTLTVYGDHPHIAEDWVHTARKFGFSANVEKQLQSPNELHYLQLVFHEWETRNAGVVQGSYPALLAVNSAKNPERWVSIPDGRATDRERAMEAIRLISIGNNCRDNPAFPEIVEMFMRGSPTHCGFTLPKEAFDLPEKAVAKVLDFMWQHGVVNEKSLDQLAQTKVIRDGVTYYDVGPTLAECPFMQVASQIQVIE